MHPEKLRAWFWCRQGLDGSLQGRSEAEVLTHAGWARSVGGVSPYLTLHSRSGNNRASVDEALKKEQIHELPSARGCTYVIPRQDFALALKVGEAFGGGEMKNALKLGVTEKEIEKLEQAILKALKTSGMEPDQLREAVGGAARSLGEEGKKKGLTTTLPVALGRLQSRGEIRRIPVNGRLDQQRYRYAAWPANPLAGFKLSLSEAYTELACRYFDWIGPATLAEFQWFSGLGTKAAKEATAPLDLQPLETGSDRLMPRYLRKEWDAFIVPATPQYALLGSLDSLVLLRRNLTDLINAEDQNRMVPGEKGSCELGGLSDLPSHGIFDRGRLVGLWEFEADSGRIAWASFTKPGPALKDRVAATEAYVASELGDARSFSLDSPKSRASRIEGLRKMAASV